MLNNGQVCYLNLYRNTPVCAQMYTALRNLNADWLNVEISVRTETMLDGFCEASVTN
jgi:hypothetical protein